VAVEITFGPERFSGQLKDVCRDAALVEVKRPLALGDQVALVLALPGTDGPFQVAGPVVRIASLPEGAQDAAVLFADVTPAAEARIDLFIAAQSASA
jgi:hypothetical protein